MLPSTGVSGAAAAVVVVVAVVVEEGILSPTWHANDSSAGI